MSKTTPGAFAEAYTKTLDLIGKIFSSKRMRYSLEANKQSLKAMKRAEKIAPALLDDKIYKKYKDKFMKLIVSQ